MHCWKFLEILKSKIYVMAGGDLVAGVFGVLFYMSAIYTNILNSCGLDWLV